MAADYPPGFRDMLDMPFYEALFGRRARRFALGDTIPDGVLQYESKHDPMPLSELETMLVVTAAAGNTAWHHMIYRGERYAPYLSNYCGAAGGRTFPSAAGFHTSQLFFTDDSGVYFFDTRDAPALVDRGDDGSVDIEELLQAHRSRVRKLADGRLHIPHEVPYMEAHNTWCVNVPGSLLLIPMADAAQHFIANICYFLQNGFGLCDDINNREIPGLKKFPHLTDQGEPVPLSFLEQMIIGECSVEVGCSCYAGALMLQAMGLGGWMYNGINPYVVLGASGEPDVPGLGFRYDTREDWPLPNPTGLPGVMEGFCPPHYPDMRAAVEALVERKYGEGGPYNPGTPGPWKESSRVRGAAQLHDEEFKECVTLQCQYVYDTFGKIPALSPSIWVIMYLQAHHLDLEFYDEFYEPGSYLRTHAEHMEKWHSGSISK